MLNLRMLLRNQDRYEMKQSIVYCFIGMIFGCFFLGAPLIYADDVKQETILELTSSKIKNKLIAVHATDSLPDNGYLRRAGPENDEGTQIIKILQKIRGTLHFSLGELVRELDDEISWDLHRVAVLIPLKDLMSQLININCYDTFILGDYKLNERSVVVKPFGMDHNDSGEYQIYGYDPEKTTLREAVDIAISMMGGWSIRMINGADEGILEEAFLEDFNINTKEFFLPLLRNRPYLSVGLRFDPLDGENYRLFMIEMLALGVGPVGYFFDVIQWPEPCSDQNLSLDNIFGKIERLKYHHEIWKDFMQGFEMNGDGKSAFDELSLSILGLENLAKLEHHLQMNYSKTVKGVEGKNLEALAIFYSDLDALIGYFDHHHLELESLK